MDKDVFMRRVLWVAAAFNLGAAFVLAFPASWIGQLAGLPVPVPPIYTTLLAFFVILFGGAYAWLACQPSIDRPLVALAVFGKTGVFIVVLGFWLFGAAPDRGLLAACGDLVFAAIFVWWLLSPVTRR